MTNKINLPSNRNFGIVFSVFFFIIGLFPILDEGKIRYWAIVIGIIFLILGLLNSSKLQLLNNVWTKFGLLLGKVFSPIILSFIFFLIIAPIAILLKIYKKDILLLKKNKKNTYWIKYNNEYDNFNNQF